MSKTLESLANLATITLAVCALGLTGMTAYRLRSPASPASKPVAHATNTASLVAAGHRVGPANAPVTVVAFSDYQCPFCRRLAAAVYELRKRDPNGLSVVWRNYPIPAHPQSQFAAKAAECADKQGRFDEMHIRLFQLFDSLDAKAWHRQLGSVIPDSVRFARCLADSSIATVIAADVRLADSIGLAGTPMIFVNNEQYNGFPPDFDRIVKNARGKR